jgi:prepilin-type N-terminal cleavage/methylation domain-containing protein
MNGYSSLVYLSRYIPGKGDDMRSKNNSRGITLIELIIAVVIVGLVVAMAAPRFGKVVPRLEFKSASRDMVSDLRWARSLAIAQRTQVGLYFDWQHRQYLLFKDLVNLPALTYETGDLVLKNVILDPNLSMTSCSFTNYTIVFKPDGSASSSGGVVVSYNQGSDLANVGVLASTGRVKLTYQ